MASGSIEMYLVTIALLQSTDELVPLSSLAQELSISPVSANEMCRKLVEQGLVEYQPYKGVALTDAGEELAQCVLCRRRLWEVFLVEKLGTTAEEAEEIACQLEHATPDELTDRLAIYLKHPSFSPQNHPITCSYDDSADRPIQPLTTLTAGQQGRVVSVVASDETTRDFLRAQGVFAGACLDVLAVAADGSLLLEVSGQHLSLSPTLAAYVDVIPIEEEYSPESIASLAQK